MCRDSLRVLMDIVGAEALYPMVGLCQRCSMGSRREGGIIGRKSPTFVDSRQADRENFGQNFQTVLQRWISSGRDPCKLDLRLGPIATLEGCTVGWKSMPDFRFSQKRGKSVWKFDSITFECLIDLKAPFYLFLHTVIHKFFGVLGLLLGFYGFLMGF